MKTQLPSFFFRLRNVGLLSAFVFATLGAGLLACGEWKPLECRSDDDCDVPKYDHLEDPVCLNGLCGECPKGNPYCNEEKENSTPDASPSDTPTEPPPLPDDPKPETGLPEFPDFLPVGSQKLHQSCDDQNNACERGLYCFAGSCLYWCAKGADTPADVDCQAKLRSPKASCAPSERGDVWMCVIFQTKGETCDESQSLFCDPASLTCSGGVCK